MNLKSKIDQLTPYLTRLAYSQGIFPMDYCGNGTEIGWFRPRRRALFPIEGIRVSRSLAKTIRNNTFQIKFDTDFEQVMRGCLRPNANWISERIIQTYCEIHRQGWAHCSETWKGGRLVGGVYGLAIGACFCAESMFHRETDASKVALWALVDKCRDLGFTLFDAQIMNPHLASLGAFEISDREYRKKLAEALQGTTPWSNKEGTP